MIELCDLCEDVQRLIVEFCDHNSSKSLSETNRLWRQIVGEARTNILKHKNGLYFDLQSFQQNGPVFMPFLTDVKIHSTDQDIIHGLRALNIPSIKRRKIDLYLQGSNFTREVSDFIASISWNFVITQMDRPVSLKIECEILHTYPTQFIALDISGLKELVIMEGFGNANYIDTLEKAFSMNIEKLEFGGTLTNAFMQHAYIPNSPKTKCLILYRESNCNWSFFYKIQRALPNIEEFTLQSSNLVAEDFKSFDFTLWPSLQGLNFDYNYTLKIDPLYFKSLNLKSLKLFKCQPIYPLNPEAFGFLKSYACSVDLGPESQRFLKQFKNLEHIDLQITRYVNEDLLQLYFYEFTHLKTLNIEFMELITTQHMLNCVRSILIDTLVQIKR